ncbi:hypothetical protein CRYUN_Cryun15aG0116700 [Craigia yunnanensis]
MEKFHWDKLHEPLIPLLFLVLFLSYQLLSSAYTLPDKYFINCGSNININVTSRTFVGDLNSTSVSFTKQNSSVTDSRQSSETPSLYQTARIFRQKSSYEFEINTNGTYLVRLHFFNSTDLSAAVFNVSASGFLLLHNFTVQNSSSSTLIKEFILSIPIGKFLIYFVPQGSSFAFVNAIEVFPAPPDFIYDEATQISQTGNSNEYKGILSLALQTIHRINVGGPTLTLENDTLLRTWLPDDSYLYNPDTAKSHVFTGRPNYLDHVNEFIAPDLLYKTAKEMNINESRLTNNFNITWSYDVTRSARHLIRVHFCDIVSVSENVLKNFLYINSNFSLEINPYERMGQSETPFFIDFVVASDDSGFMNISIGPDGSSPEPRTAFLNGVEIMEMMRESDLVPITNKSNQKSAFIIVGSVFGGLVLVCIIGGLVFTALRRKKQKPVETSDWSPLHEFKGSTHRNWKTLQLSTLRTEGTINATLRTEGTINASPVPNLNLCLKIPFFEIQLATNNFDKKLQIGKGGFGNVYRGTLQTGIKVAVKRSEPGTGQGARISNGDHRFIQNSPSPSSRGLHYLHKGASGGIIHRDVKSTNILLDENLVAKVADFGLSRSGPPDQTYVSTGVKGTFGYLDPEYFRTQQLTEKSDVYSFGVVLLEVLCARPAINPTLPRDQVNLGEWGMLCKKKGLLEQIVDPSIQDQIKPNSLRKFAEIAEKCLQDDSADRPTMGDVAWDLEYALQLQQTAVVREPHEESTSNASDMLSLPILQRFPSMSAELGSNDMSIIREDDSDSVPLASEVFSQLRINDAR